MKRKSILITTVLTALVLSGCAQTQNRIGVKSINFTSSINELEVDKTFQFEVEVNPSDATDSSVTWSVSNTSYASISETGLLTALSEGSVTVTATSVSNPNIKADCPVEIKKKEIPATSITLNASTKTLTVGDSFTLVGTVKPDNATNKVITWISSDSDIVTVDNGVITAKAAGTSTITAKTHNDLKATCSIRVNNPTIDVESVSLDVTSKELNIGDSFTLNATVKPDNATNKTITWSSSNSTVATVSSGVVTAKASGTATITAKSNNNKTATCSITVNRTDSDWALVENNTTLVDGDKVVIAYPTSNLTASTEVKSSSGGGNYLATATSTFSSDKKSIDVLANKTAIFTLGKVNGGWTFTNESGQLLGSDKAKSLNFSSSNTTWTVSISSGSATITNTNSSSGTILCNTSNPRFTTYTSTSSGQKVKLFYSESARVPVDPIGVNLPTSLELSAGSSKKLDVTYNPGNANQNKEVNWSSSNTSIATVDSEGTVKVSENAAIGSKVIITAALKIDANIKASCEITIVEQVADPYTILIYLCGSDLESNGGYATSDLKEILNVSGKPENVNIVIQTGGASRWSSTYGISANELGRYVVTTDRKLQKVDSLTKASMGLQSTFENFLKWGLETYPAEKTGLIMWNHGGALDGVCFDETDNYNSLTNDEVNAALKNAFNYVGRTEPLEWIGYDACLMAVQDIAEFNSHYFNYMIASQETEAGDGWDYDGGWLADLYKNPTGDSLPILSKICDTFISDNSYYGEATLSVLDLKEMDTYLTAWENMADKLSTIITSSTAWNTFNNLVKNCTQYGYDSSVGYTYDVLDVEDLLTKMKSSTTYKTSLADELSALTEAFNKLVAYNKTTSDMNSSDGLCFFCPVSGYNSRTYYSASQTNFSKWRTLVTTYGKWRS